MAKTVITPKIGAYIRENYLKESGNKMSRKLGISETAVRRFMRINGLKVSQELSDEFRAEALRGRTSFTAEEDAFIADSIEFMAIKEIAESIGRSYVGVMGRIRAMGIVIPAHIRERNKLRGRIKKGDVPPNKGRKRSEWMSRQMEEKVSKTQFKKGNLPHNTAAGDGEIRIRRHGRTGVESKWIRVSLGKWRPLHRHLWEQNHGPVPDGMALKCQDGDTLNADPSNWKLITRKALRLLNSGIAPLTNERVAIYLAPTDKNLRAELVKHPELIEIKRKQLLLNRKINAVQMGG